MEEQRAGRLAMVVTRDAQYGMTRMYEMLTERKGLWERLRIFYDRTEAEEWLAMRLVCGGCYAG